MAAPKSTDIEKVDVNSFLSELGIDLNGRSVVGAEDVIDGLGYEPIEKEKLIDVPFVIVEYAFINSDYSDDHFVVVRAVTKTQTKVFFTDGSSTGVKRQLMTALENDKAMDDQMGFGDVDWSQLDTSKASIIVCPKGLRVSRYTWTDPKDGKEKPAETFYIA